MKANVVAAKRLAEANLIRAACPEVFEAAEAALRTAWLPVDLDVRLTDAVLGASGPETLRAWSQDAMKQSMRAPLLRPFLRAIKHVGADTLTLLRRAPLGWGAVYRGCGELSFSSDSPRAASLVLSDPPRVFLRSEASRMGTAASFEVTIEIAGGRNITVAHEARVALRQMSFHFTWDD